MARAIVRAPPPRRTANECPSRSTNCDESFSLLRLRDCLPRLIVTLGGNIAVVFLDADRRLTTIFATHTSMFRSLLEAFWLLPPQSE
jgi:hypothetical protein